ncbi:MAG: hypothetical protein AB8E82_02640 [Aureispira sp.]
MTNYDQDSSIGEQTSLALHVPSESSSNAQQVSSDLFTAQVPIQEKDALDSLQTYILSPSMSSQNTCTMALPKGKLEILFQGAGVQQLSNETITLSYYSKGTDDEASEEVQVVEQAIGPLLQA